jgi:hypothetical protein
MARNWDITGWPSENRAGAQIGFNDGQYTNPVWGAYHNVITSVDDRLVANCKGFLQVQQHNQDDYTGGVNSYALYRDQIIDKSSLGSAENALGTLTEVVNSTQEIQSTLVAIFTPKIFTTGAWILKLVMISTRELHVTSRLPALTLLFLACSALPILLRQRFNSDSRTTRRLVGFFGDATVGYKNFAFLNLTGRTDLTSTLPYKNATYFYPGVSGSLVWSDAFKLKSNWLDYGKFRAGWAKVGNDAGPHNGEAIFGLTQQVSLVSLWLQEVVQATIRILHLSLLQNLNSVQKCVSLNKG